MITTIVVSRVLPGTVVPVLKKLPQLSALIFLLFNTSIPQLLKAINQTGSFEYIDVLKWQKSGKLVKI
jgi:hypothetical protein